MFDYWRVIFDLRIEVMFVDKPSKSDPHFDGLLGYVIGGYPMNYSPGC